MADCHAGACGSLSLSLVVESDSASAGAERPARLRGRKQQAPAVIAPVVVVVVTKQECLHARSCAKLFWGFLRGEMWRPPTGGEGGFGGGSLLPRQKEHLLTRQKERRLWSTVAFNSSAQPFFVMPLSAFFSFRATVLFNGSIRALVFPNGSLHFFDVLEGSVKPANFPLRARFSVLGRPFHSAQRLCPTVAFNRSVQRFFVTSLRAVFISCKCFSQRLH